MLSVSAVSFSATFSIQWGATSPAYIKANRKGVPEMLTNGINRFFL